MTSPAAAQSSSCFRHDARSLASLARVTELIVTHVTPSIKVHGSLATPAPTLEVSSGLSCCIDCRTQSAAASATESIDGTSFTAGDETEGFMSVTTFPTWGL
jgi:hypothetical protein